MFKFKEFFNKEGEFLPDPDPIVLAPAFQRPPTLAEQMARLIRSPEFASRLTGREDMETFEEADDFDIDDDVDVRSPWEENFDYAALAAVDRGFVSPPTSQAHYDAKERSKPFFKRKSKEKATPLPKEEAVAGVLNNTGAKASGQSTTDE